MIFQSISCTYVCVYDAKLKLSETTFYEKKAQCVRLQYAQKAWVSTLNKLPNYDACRWIFLMHERESITCINNSYGNYDDEEEKKVIKHHRQLKHHHHIHTVMTGQLFAAYFFLGLRIVIYFSLSLPSPSYPQHAHEVRFELNSEELQDFSWVNMTATCLFLRMVELRIKIHALFTSNKICEVEQKKKEVKELEGRN